VSIGEPLQSVLGSYERSRCGEAVAGEPIFGGDTPMYGWCRARVAGASVFFGGDPIESITLTFAGDVS
jgi:hypothetical protein